MIILNHHFLNLVATFNKFKKQVSRLRYFQQMMYIKFCQRYLSCNQQKKKLAPSICLSGNVQKKK